MSSQPEQRKFPKELTREKTRELCSFLRTLCKELRLRSVTTGSAFVFFHRALKAHARQGGLAKHDPKDVAMACVFLAGKVQENAQHVRKVVAAAYKPETDDKKLWEKQQDVVRAERAILDVIEFKVDVESSHLNAIVYLNQVCQKFPREDREKVFNAFKQDTYNILNDSLYTDMCLRFSAKVIAVAAMLLAAKMLRERKILPPHCVQVVEEMESSGVVCDFAMEDIVMVQDEMISFYAEMVSENQAHSRHSSPVFGPASTSPLRQAVSQQPMQL